MDLLAARTRHENRLRRALLVVYQMWAPRGDKIVKRTALQRKTPVNLYSVKRLEAMVAEVPIRQELCRRAVGEPVLIPRIITRNGVHYDVPKVLCINGICGLCGKRHAYLEPHEEPFRSHGGKVSLKDSRMVGRACHNKRQNNSPKWSKTS